MTSDRSSPAWERAGYADIVAAARQGTDIGVEFANGDVVRVPASTFGIADEAFEVESGPDEGLNIVVTVSDGRAIEITWTQLRSAADPLFAQELRRRDAEQSKRIGLRLKALREDRNLNQRDLATHVGMAAPQLSKIESGTSDLRVSTVQTLLRAMGAELSELVGPDGLEVSRRSLRKLAEKEGVSNDLMDRLLAVTPRRLLVQTLARGFGWDSDGIAEGRLVTPSLAMPVRLKANKNSEPLASPLIHLGYEVAKVIQAAPRAVRYQTPPSDPKEIWSAAKDQKAQVTLESLLEWMWGSGMPVVPLLGRKGFSAGVWQVNDMPIVVLKEARPFAVYWLFDLGHELGHIALGHVSETAVVDVEAPKLHYGNDADEEAASAFALDLLLPDHEQLLADVRTDSKGSYLRFKFAVEDVATRAGVSPGLLGMVAAYELTDIGDDKDRWGSASNLAKSDGSGRPIAESVAGRYLPMAEFPDVEAAILQGAVLTGA